MNIIKKNLKQFLPQKSIVWLRTKRQLLEKNKLFAADKKRFMNHYSKSWQKGSQEQLKAQLIFAAHSLEKGMSHAEVRLGFGEMAIIRLTECMLSYKQSGYDVSALEYKNALSVLETYLKIHKNAKHDLSSSISDRIKPFLEEISEDSSQLGGYLEVDGQTKLTNQTKPFAELFANRWSVREYSAESVDLGTVKQAVEMATKSPSVCNRQPVRVKIIETPEILEKFVQLHGGFSGYGTPPLVLAVTSDFSSFVAVTERNQPYVEGGTFAMSLLLALENLGLAACPINAMFEVSKERKIRSLLTIPDNEALIMFITVGNFRAKNLVAKSFRKPATEIYEII